MTDRERLLKAILDSPEEDTPRLMYADELEATDPARAEFIRVGCELASMPPEYLDREREYPLDAVDGVPVGFVMSGVPPGVEYQCTITDGERATVRWKEPNPAFDRARHAEVQAREGELFAAHAYDWLPEIAGLDKFAIGRRGGAGSYSVGYLRKVTAPRGVQLPDPPPRLTTEFRRGFVERVTCSGDDWARHGDDILAAHPVRRVTFTDQGPSMVGVSFRPGPQFGTTVFRFAGRDVTVTASSPAHVLVNPSQFFTARWPIPPEGWAFAAGSRPPPF
ncbi:MAG TPA: TIGR02996 domain-containing protein [Gemmata sp.]|nr:TIGR02996 domain-containing protein [Gemmata sp.]